MKKDRRVDIKYSGSDWINVRASDVGRGRGLNVAEQGYHMFERRWSNTNFPLTAQEKATGLAKIGELKNKLQLSELGVDQ